MTSRQRVLTALSKKKPDRVPREISWGAFTPALMKVFREKTGADDPAEYFNFEVRPVNWAPTKFKKNLKELFKDYLPDLSEEAVVGEWGIASLPGSMYHFTRNIHPMRNLNSKKEILDYPFPDIKASYRYRNLKSQVEKLKRRDLAVTGELYCTIFETAWGLRGMDNLLVDFLINPDLVKTLLDILVEIRCEQAKRFAEAGVDILRLGDDVGSQKGMLMSPEVWRKWLKPGLKKVIKSARDINPEIHIFYHSDGYIEPIIPELIEIGVDILNPVQPECMDPAKLKREYGDKLAFWGTVSCQRTMPFGTPEDVINEVKLRIKTVGENGGLLIAPTHILEPDVPWENVLAFFEGVKKYGRYDT